MDIVINSEFFYIEESKNGKDFIELPSNHGFDVGKIFFHLGKNFDTEIQITGFGQVYEKTRGWENEIPMGEFQRAYVTCSRTKKPESKLVEIKTIKKTSSHHNLDFVQ